MALQNELAKEVAAIFNPNWTTDKALVVPTANSDLLLNSNHAKLLDSATVLYADLDGSTAMVDANEWYFAAEVYKAYLRCASQIIRSEQGTIAAYDGDRVMGVFFGEYKNTRAVRAGLKINGAVTNIINPALRAKYVGTNFVVTHVVGIDTSPLHVAKIGVHRDNDLVWVGRAANYAAKLCSLSGKPTWITKAVYDRIAPEAKLCGQVDMWERYTWNAMNKIPIYCSTYLWKTI